MQGFTIIGAEKSKLQRNLDVLANKVSGPLNIGQGHWAKVRHEQ